MANYYQKEDKTEFFRTPKWMIEKCYKMIPNAKTILDPCAGDCGLEDFTRDVEYIYFIYLKIFENFSIFFYKINNQKLYQYGNNILDIRWIPLLIEIENRKNYELF